MSKEEKDRLKTDAEEQKFKAEAEEKMADTVGSENETSDEAAGSETAASQEDRKTDASGSADEFAGAETEAKEDSKNSTKEDEDLQTKYLRLAADFQNYKRRTEKEKADIYSYGNEKFAVDILDVIDNFERAMAAAPEDDKFAEGIELILKQLTTVLTKNGVSEIEAMGKPFDPNFHNAVMTENAEDGVESGTITKVLQKGYLLNSKVIRPSMVAVAQ